MYRTRCLAVYQGLCLTFGAEFWSEGFYLAAVAPLAPRLLRHVSLHSASGDPGDFPSKPGRSAAPAGCACQDGPGCRVVVDEKSRQARLKLDLIRPVVYHYMISYDIT